MNFAVFQQDKPHRNNLYIYDDEYKKRPDALHVNNKGYDKDKFVIQDDQKYFFDTKIRWSNLGQHYDWDRRCYFKDSESPLPDNLKLLAKQASNIFDCEDYNPQSVIVNYYGRKKNMGGHLDDGEPDQTHPIVSFSLGLSCIFLIGGQTKEEQPIAVLLQSGDLCYMGQYSRKCYHGVPKVIQNTFQKDILIQGEPEDKPNNNQNVINFLKEYRINMNLRQVVYEQNNYQIL